jgi:hypothetical protein
MKFARDRMDRGWIRGGIWLINDTSDACMALARAIVGRGLLPFLWGLGLFSLSIGSYS